MTTPPDTSTSPDDAGGGVGGGGTPPSTQGPAGATGPGSPSGDGAQPIAAAPFRRTPRLPSLRASAALAVGMLAIGVAVGAAIGPAPSASLAGQQVAPLVLRSIAALAATGSGAHASAAPVAPPPVAPQATPTASTGASTNATTQAPKSKTPPSTSVSPTSRQHTSKAPTTGVGGATKQTTTPLPPVTSVWLITLAGGTFAQALAQPTAAPYIDSQLVKAGTLLSGWSSLAGSAFASEAGLLGGTPPQNLDAIVQPPCPEGAAGLPCKPETAGALSAADEFLKATVPMITSNPAYGAHGLIVITFGTVGNATASSLPAGSSTATLGSEPPAGVLLISPFARAGARPSTAYDPTSPKQSLSALLH
jgi:hypothetical protein